ncbi:ig-like and fibronectin type-III domain-containing protein 2 [Trichonephila clavipes]|nr:ig-like and fibronectin type-III domain-containing protein 2 [Trichonephila clavipes]
MIFSQVQRIAIVEFYFATKSHCLVINAFQQKYPGETAPNASTITLSVQRFRDTGLVADKKRSGRASIVKEKVVDLQTCLRRSPIKRPSIYISIIMEFISLLNCDERGVLEKVSVLWDFPTVSSEEFVAVDDDNLYTAPIMADKDILEFVQGSNNIFDADSDDEKEMTNAAPVPMSSEIGNIMKTDVLMCAPFVNITFECMAGGADHSHCCQQRGLPDICLDFCRGNVTQLDYRHFICLDHIDIYGNCLLEYYKVLPGAPEQFLVSMVHSRWAVLKWSPPSVLPESVLSYVLYWKEVAMDEIIEYNVVNDVKSPHLLDNLKPQTRYEVYVAARNAFGLSRGSVRAVFTTSPEIDPAEMALEKTPAYNETACCIAAGLKKSCLDLCTYNMKMSDLQLLAIPCANQLEILVRCGAGGRDHSSCCQRRGIRWECLPICSAMIEMSPQAVVSTCIGDAGKIIQCMAEGVGQLPGSPEDLRTQSVLPTRIHVRWKFHNTTADPVWFEVRYTETQEKIPPHPLDYAYVENTTETDFDLKELKSNAYYSIYVMAMNEHGPSLPSLVLLVHTPERDEIYNETIEASLGPPHSLEVTHQTMDSVSLSWRSPFHVPANSSLNYLVFYKPVNNSGDIEESSSKLATTNNYQTLNNLTVNTQYAIAVQARTGHQESPLSETVLAWTDPAIPAFVNPPVVVPPEPIVEGANVTLLCVATGMPVPVVSLFLNGQLVVQQQQSHVALVVPNIQHNVTKVDCFADNGLGTGAQSSTSLEVNFMPHVEMMDKRIPAEEGSISNIRCLVTGHPEPRVLWYRDRKLREPLKKGPDYDLNIKPYGEKPYTYMASLTLLQVTTSHEGQYFCYAENTLGKDTVFVNLDVLPKLYSNASACCAEKKVSDECQEACSVDIDIQMALNKPKCFKDLDKLMYCAAGKHCRFLQCTVIPQTYATGGTEWTNRESQIFWV